jgi:hypothetical protein
MARFVGKLRAAVWKARFIAVGGIDSPTVDLGFLSVAIGDASHSNTVHLTQGTRSDSRALLDS